MKNYNFLQKQLHHLCLGNKTIKKSLFEIEKLIFKKKISKYENNCHVFITGLPRSGTTILLEFLYKTNQYASLTYNDMPFVLSPNLSSKFINRQNFDLKERMHKDNIRFNLQSPEAFDEVFFQTFKQEEIEENLKIFISLILHKYNKQHYLSKNNNNYKRIDLVQSIFPSSKFLIPFRDPLQQANSLLHQHIHFLSIQSKDKFILNYMNYLGHFEFGLNHQCWYEPKSFRNFDKINYWLEQWYLFYSKMARIYHSSSSVLFICYENLCNKEDSSSKLINKLNLKYNANFNFTLSKKDILDVCDENLLNRCNEIYRRLFNFSIV